MLFSSSGKSSRDLGVHDVGDRSHGVGEAQPRSQGGSGSDLEVSSPADGLAHQQGGLHRRGRCDLGHEDLHSGTQE